MKHKFIRSLAALMLIAYLLPVQHAMAWTDQAHMAVGLAAGFRSFETCASADISHTVAEINGLTQTDSKAHYFNTPSEHTVCKEDVYAQLDYIGQSGEDCPNGYLLGAILHTARLCIQKTQAGAFDDYYYSVLLHYAADLSNPLHLSPYDEFNRAHHFPCDHILSDTEAEYPVFAAVDLAARLTVDDDVRFENEEQLVDAIVSLARQSQELSKTIRRENRNVTVDEALLQLSRSATLGKAILRYCGKI